MIWYQTRITSLAKRKKWVNILVIFFFFEQKDATNALEKMTSVLKAESVAGESYDSLLDGAKSLVTGLGSLLRVVSYEASVYDSHSQKKSNIKASFITTDKHISRKSRRLAFRSRTSYSRARMSERDASDAQLQVKKRLELRVQNLNYWRILS